MTPVGAGRETRPTTPSPSQGDDEGEDDDIGSGRRRGWGGAVASDTMSAMTIDCPPPFFALSRSLPLTTVLVSVSSVVRAALVRHGSGEVRCDGVTRGGSAS